MKSKLQVVDAAVDSIKFGLTNIPMIIRLGWVGFVLYLLIYVGGMVYAFGSELFSSFVHYGMEQGFEHFAELSDSWTYQIVSGGLSILGWLVTIPFIVIIRRIAAGETEAPGGIAYFRFGGREIGFILSNIILTVLSIVVVIAFFLPSLIAFVASILQGVTADMVMNAEVNPGPLEDTIERNIEDGGMGLTALIGILLFIAGFIATIWYAVRASLFTTAAAVEGKPLPFGAFGLTGGNVWRIIGSAILWFLMVMLIYLVFALAFGLTVGLLALVGVMTGGGEPGIVFMIMMIIAGILGVIALIAFICAMVGVEQSFPAKIYASITRSGTAPSEA